MPKPCLILAHSNPAEGQEDEYNEWYDNVHLPDVLAVPGIRAAHRYRFVEAELQESEQELPPAPHKYLAVYEVDGDPGSVLVEFAQRIGDGRMVIDPSIDRTTIGMSVWAPRP